MRCLSARVVGSVLGSVLVVAGVLKFVDPGEMPSTVVTTFASAWVETLLPVAEIAFGSWLLTQRWRFGSWAVAVVVFSGFALHTLRLGLAGQVSCGCLGSVQVNPWYTLAFDAAAVLALLVWRPRWTGWPATSELRAVGVASGLLAACLVGGLLLALGMFGSLGAAVAQLRGEPFVVSPYPVNVGVSAPSEEMVADFDVTNYDDAPVQIIGGARPIALVW